MTAGPWARLRQLLLPGVVMLLLLAVVLVTVHVQAAAPGGSPVAGADPGPAGPGTRARHSAAQASPLSPVSVTPSVPVITAIPSAPVSASAPASVPVPVGGLAQLPLGGRTLFPRYRLVGYSGGPGTAAFGRLGIGDIDARVREIERSGRSYTAGHREILPVLELITVVVHSAPGKDGKYRGRIDDATINRYLAAARRHHALLLLNIQPGRADFLPEVQALAPWLQQPDVGIALDPEWAVGPQQVPGRVFGHTTAKELNQVGAWLGAFTRHYRLPEKAMIVHQLATRIISNVGDVKAHKGVQVVLSVDGIGARSDKESTWRTLVRPLPDAVRPGFKLFFEEDRIAGPLMTPRQVLELRPRPDYVLYE